MNLLSKFLKEKRDKKKMTQPQFAKAIGIGYQTYVKLEVGKRKFSADSLISIAKTFNLSLKKIDELNKNE